MEGPKFLIEVEIGGGGVLSGLLNTSDTLRAVTTSLLSPACQGLFT